MTAPLLTALLIDVTMMRLEQTTHIIYCRFEWFAFVPFQNKGTEKPIDFRLIVMAGLCLSALSR